MRYINMVDNRQIEDYTERRGKHQAQEYHRISISNKTTSLSLTLRGRTISSTLGRSSKTIKKSKSLMSASNPKPLTLLIG